MALAKALLEPCGRLEAYVATLPRPLSHPMTWEKGWASAFAWSRPMRRRLRLARRRAAGLSPESRWALATVQSRGFPDGHGVMLCPLLDLLNHAAQRGHLDPRLARLSQFAWPPRLFDKLLFHGFGVTYGSKEPQTACPRPFMRIRAPGASRGHGGRARHRGLGPCPPRNGHASNSLSGALGLKFGPKSLRSPWDLRRNPLKSIEIR